MIASQKDRVILNNICYTFDGISLTNPLKIPVDDHTSVLAMGKD